VENEIKSGGPRSQFPTTSTHRQPRPLTQKYPIPNEVEDQSKDSSDLLDYAVGVENRLRKDLHAVLKQLEHEQGKTRKLERRVRELEDAVRSQSRTGTASPLTRDRITSPSLSSERGRASSPAGTRCTTGGGLRVAARSRSRLATSQTVWLQQHGGAGRPPALDRLDPADAARSKPALLAACEQAIANDLRRLDPAGPGEGELPAVRARLEIFQTAFDAIIENFQARAPNLCFV
jgi:hypothetical protein